MMSTTTTPPRLYLETATAREACRPLLHPCLLFLQHPAVLVVALRVLRLKEYPLLHLRREDLLGVDNSTLIIAAAGQGISRINRGDHGRRGARQRVQGVGANPDDDVRHKSEEQGRPDPCWKCGDAVSLVDYGSGSFYSCSSRPLCNAKRPTFKNGAVVELVAEETLAGAVPEADSPSASTSERAEHGGITRCHLAVTVLGGHRGGAAQAAWDMLGKHGVIPERQRGDDRSSNIQPKALIEMGKRNSIRSLVKQAGIAYRDVPQATYGRLMASGAGTPAGGGGDGKRAKSVTRRLERSDVCRGLLYMLPDGLRETLLPFQRDGVLYGLRRNGRCLIADEMGTGKTLQALGIMGCYKEDWPLLIVAPASMRLMWAEEVEHWYPFLSPGEVHLIKGSKDKLYLTNLNRYLWPRVVIVSYFMLRMLSDSIGRDDWKAVIFDESHMISTKLGDERSQAQQVSVCVDVAKRAKRVVMVSGTPALSKPFEIFNQVEALSSGLLGQGPLYKAKHDFAANYCGGTMREQSRNGSRNRVPFLSGCYQPDELHLLLKNEVMIRRLKKNVIDQLPPLRRIVVRVMERTEDLKKALDAGGYEADHAESEDEEEDGGARGRGNKSTRLGGMSEDQRAGLKKVRSASEWVVDKLFASEETLTKFVVFAHHRTVLDRLQEAFEVAGSRREAAGEDGGCSGFTCLRIDGEVPTTLRASRLLEFNTQERCRVLLVSITAGGQGLDFTAASNVVFVELPESPAWLRQAEDRLHRRRQEKSVNVYLTVLPPGSHDDTRWLSLNEKLRTQTSVMNGTARAENIDVDKVFEFGGGVAGTGGESQSQPSKRGRDHVGAAPEVDSEEDSDASDSHPSESHASDGGDDDDEIGGGLSCVEETEFDAELRAALRTTPLELPPAYTKSQSPTLQLLRAIADSPAAPRPKDAGTPAKASFFTRAVGMRGTQARPSPEGRGGSKIRGGKRGATGKGANLRASSAPRERGSLLLPATSPGGRKKRPRPSSGYLGGSNPSPSNPFRAFHLRPLPPPRPSPPPGRVSSPRKAGPGVIREISAGVSIEGGSVDKGGEVRVSSSGKAEPGVLRDIYSGVSMEGGSVDKRGDVRVSSSGKAEPGVLRDISSGVSIEGGIVEEGDDYDDFVLSGAAAVSKVRCSSQALEKGVHHGGSPFASLVDLSELDGEDEHPSARDTARLEETESWQLGLSQESSGRHAHGGVDVSSPASSSSWRDKNQGRDGRGGETGGGVKAEEEEAASKLLFLVSGNTGRVHVYKQAEEEDVGRLDDSFDEDQRRPQHCRCNFRPEDLDRLFEASKAAWAPSSVREGSDACEVMAREALNMLPGLVRSAPALRVARRFVQEWRALSSRKRPLLKGTPCRPPLAKELAKVTPELTGSTRRYADAVPTIGGGDGGNSTTDNRRQEYGQVMCLFCEEEAASEQGQAAHRRDRFCSVKCMEAHASRSSGGSLRRLVLERDQGICSEESCGRDCVALVSRLRAVQNIQKRREILRGVDPRFDDDRNDKLRERLVRQPIGGYAWNADHVTAVFQGGGECGVDNLRTLCVICHAKVTREQTAKRAADKRISKEKSRMALEEAQGQRRLVSFGGEITLSAPSQGSETSSLAGVRRAEQGSQPGGDRELDSDAGDDVVFMPSPIVVPAASGARSSGRRSTANCDSRCGQTSGGAAGNGSVVRPSLEAFERLISGEDFSVHSPPAPSLIAVAGSKGYTSTKAATPGGGGNDSKAVKSGDGSSRQDDGSGSDTCEITFTRVRRLPRSSGTATTLVGSVTGGLGSSVASSRVSFDYLLDSP